MRTEEQIQAELLSIVRRQQTDYLESLLDERERYMYWLATSRHYPDAYIEFKVNQRLVAMISAELFVRRGSQ